MAQVPSIQVRVAVLQKFSSTSTSIQVQVLVASTST